MGRGRGSVWSHRKRPGLRRDSGEAPGQSRFSAQAASATKREEEYFTQEEGEGKKVLSETAEDGVPRRAGRIPAAFRVVLGLCGSCAKSLDVSVRSRIGP